MGEKQEKKTYPLAHFLHRFITVCFAKRMLAKKDRLGRAVMEPHKRMLPVADVIAEPNPEDFVPKVIAVKVKPKGVDHAVPLIQDY